MITELYWDCSPTYVNYKIFYTFFPVEIHGKIYNAGNGTAHDVRVDYKVVDITYPITDAYVSECYTVGKIKPGEEKEFRIVDNMVSASDVKAAKEYDFDLITKIEIIGEGYRLEIEKDGNWLKRAYERCVILL